MGNALKKGEMAVFFWEKKKFYVLIIFVIYIQTLLYIYNIYICKDIGKRDTGRRAVHTLGAKKGDLRG